MGSETTSKIVRVMDLRGTYKGGGGPDKTVLNSAAQHDPGQVHVLVTYLRQPWDDEFQIPEMARRLGINYVDVFDGNGIDWGCLKQLHRLIREHQLEVLHAHDDKTMLYGWLLRFVNPELRIMYTCHSHAVHGRHEFARFGDYLRFKVRQKIQIFLMKRYPQPVVTISCNTRQRLVDNGLLPAAVQVLHNGVDLATWRNEGTRPVLKEELGLEKEELVVGTVARITYEKDFPTFFRVVRLVVDREPRVRFVIVGDGYGDELELARAEACRLGLAGVVHFAGHRNDLRDVYASLDVFLMTSLTEGMPNTLLEAMALGVPSVSTAVGGIPELLVHGEGGFLAPVGDAEALAGHVLRLVCDAGLRAECGRRCRERVEARFSFGRRVRQMERYYRWFAGVGELPECDQAGHGG
ncbi:glycosyl transferase family 1 [Geomonas limicola]|uniref:Glycosyl transferase family 1 n=1 Tax=Geomonas limicola TaxID=2740186 RepID=A0A6V8N237_9BACT|nr:glycosyltransferase family 4 protein [Geomonas limicola]GFO66558.1 glycosyl transferase family 1 [Geomonas limicola]